MPEPGSSIRRVIVVGAGLAGLAAAEALHRAGIDAVVLEARDRVGGRVWSRTLDNGAVVEMGAEFVLPDNTEVLGLAERFRLGLWPKGMRYGDREPRGGIGVDRPTLLAAADTVRRVLADRSETGGLTAQALLDSLEIDPGAREALIARCEVSCATEAGRVPAHTLAHVAAQMDDDCPGIAGGNQRIAFALAGELGDRVHLNSAVTRIAWSEGGVRAAIDGADVVADAAILAVPASVLDGIAFDPPLPEATHLAFRSVAYGQAAKLFVPLRENAPTSAVLSVPERYWTWTATGADGRVQPVLNAFAGSLPALERLDIGRGPGHWLDSINRLRPDIAVDGDDAVLSTWHDDPWVRAAYSTPSARNNDLLTAPVRCLFFCGEHTAGEYAALMEGALRSGLRAASQLLGADR